MSTAEAPPFDVSVVVPTYNRCSLLGRTLESLRRQDAGPVRYEIIVVDNNSSDATGATVDAFGANCRNVRYLFEPRPGVSHARNAGIAAARAPIVAFIDDDVEADPSWIRTIKHALDAHPEVDCVGGKIQARWVVPPPLWLTPLFWGAVALQDEKGRSPYIDAGNAAACLMTANFACRRTALDAVGGFSPDYLRDEDRELQLRLWEAGKRGMYVADIAVTTHVPPERTTKRYHRRFYARAGRSHARMRYLDRIDHEGRLVGELPSGATLFGTPGFIYRRLLIHLAGFVWDALTWHRVDAFFHETRVIYFASYIGTRFSQERHTPRTVLRELLRCVSRVVATGRNRRRGASGRSAAIRSTRGARRVPLA